MAGMFVFILNCVVIASGWIEQRAVWGKGEIGVQKAIQNIEKALPFSILGFDCDNGSEFLNWHLLRFFTDRKRPVQFTDQELITKMTMHILKIKIGLMSGSISDMGDSKTQC